MRSFLSIALVILVSFQMRAQSQIEIPKKQNQNAFLNLDFLPISMPEKEDGSKEKDMGFTGIHFNLKLKNDFYVGTGFYGSILGERGGFFTLGVNAGIRKKIKHNIFYDAGLHFGGGGGAGAPDGGGAFILPHADIGISSKKFSTSLGYSYVNFFDNGNIKNYQLHFGIQMPLNYYYSDFNYKESKYTLQNLIPSPWNGSSKRSAILFQITQLAPSGDSRRIDSTSLSGNEIQLVGLEISNYFNSNSFTFLKADGAFNGIKAGYMDILLGAGYQLNLQKDKMHLLMKLGLGAGGGGGVDMRGGFLINPEIAFERKLTHELFLSLNGGFLINPNGPFQSSNLGFGLKQYINHQGTTLQDKKPGNQFVFKGLQMILAQELYTKAGKTNFTTENMHQIVLQLNAFVTDHVFIAGHTSFANFGNAGAYAEGAVGLGFQSSAFYQDRCSLFIQGILGAAGGGNVNTGEGLIAKTHIGADYTLSSTLSLRGSIGWVKASGGSLDSPSFQLGINYAISMLKAAN